jgi:cytochrome c peroxidase
VVLTAPYFHDGSAKTLEDAVDVMFRYQLGRPAPEQDKKYRVFGIAG